MTALSAAENQNPLSIRTSNVDGQFYPSDPETLTQKIKEFIFHAPSLKQKLDIKVIVVPHAGHAYSGQTAAHAFKAVADKSIRTVILLGPTHHYRFSGVAIWPQGFFQTPLGRVPVDQELSEKIMKEAAFVQFQKDIFDKEHALEVELPFLQEIWEQISIVPLIMNRDASVEEVQQLARALYKAVDNRDDVLLLISSDLAHYHSAEENQKIDRRGIQAVEAMDVEKIWNEHAAGQMEIDGFKEVIVGILYAKLKGARQAKLLDYSHSGQMNGDMSRVVGYGSFIFYDKREDSNALNAAQKKTLLQLARMTLKGLLKKIEYEWPPITDDRLKEEEGAFVSIYKKGRLRGCIGQILGQGPLYQTVQAMTVASATKDGRFQPVQESELDEVILEISVLSKPRRARPEDIQLGVHGVIVSRDDRSGVFLPQVADTTGWSKDEFMGQLCSQKAGLPWECWKDPETTLEIFTADVFAEKDIK